MRRDCLVLKNLPLEVRLGVREHEQLRPQRVRVDLRLFLDLEEACRTDDITRTVDYALLAEDLQTYVQTRSWNLIETLARAVTQRILDRYPVEKAEIHLHKPGAFTDGTVAGVILERSR